MPSSSVLGLADLALTWSNVQGNADLSLIDNDLATDKGLITAMILSLFTDRRAEKDDVPPSGDPRDRRGWWGDQFLPVAGDKCGSRLWLLDRSVLNNETLLKAKQYVLEAWQWMIDDGVVQSIPVTVTRISKPDGILIDGQVIRPGKDAVAFRFAHVWDGLAAELGS